MLICPLNLKFTLFERFFFWIKWEVPVLMSTLILSLTDRKGCHLGIVTVWLSSLVPRRPSSQWVWIITPSWSRLTSSKKCKAKIFTGTTKLDLSFSFYTEDFLQNSLPGDWCFLSLGNNKICMQRGLYWPNSTGDRNLEIDRSQLSERYKLSKLGNSAK